MIAVIFEVVPTRSGKNEYLAIAATLKDQLTAIPGFISVERFESLTNPDKLLSLSFWENEESVARWRNLEMHRIAQADGRDRLFRDYRIRVGTMTRDYTLTKRAQAPDDSMQWFG